MRTRVCCYMHSIAVLIVFFCFTGSICCIDLLPNQQKAPIPESSYISSHQYTNSFFGFTIALPKNGRFEIKDFSEKNDSRIHHFLFSQTSHNEGYTEWSITATQILKTPDREAREAVIFREEEQQEAPEELSIDRRLFWKNEVQETIASHTLYRVHYATAIGGFVLQFSIYSHNRKLKGELRQNIEKVKFFDPADVTQEIAADGQPYLPNAARWWLTSPPHLNLIALDGGGLTGNTYTNPHLGFSYLFPLGSRFDLSPPRERTPSLEGGPQNFSEACIRVLASANYNQRAIFNETSMNSITILAADPTCFVPDQKFPESMKDQQKLQALGGALIRVFSGGPFIGRKADPIRVAQVGKHIFLEIPSSTSAPNRGTTLRRKIYQQFVLTQIQQYWVIWILEGSTESEFDELLRSSISFNTSR